VLRASDLETTTLRIEFNLLRVYACKQLQYAILQRRRRRLDTSRSAGARATQSGRRRGCHQHGAVVFSWTARKQRQATSRARDTTVTVKSPWRFTPVGRQPPIGHRSAERALLASDRQTSHGGCRSPTADRSWPGGHAPQVYVVIAAAGHLLQVVRQRAFASL